MRRPAGFWRAFFVVVALSAAACGTRLSDEEFDRLAAGGEEVSALEDVGAVPGGSRSPDRGRSAGDASPGSDSSDDGGGSPGAGGGAAPGSGGSGAPGSGDGEASGDGMPPNAASDVGVSPTEIKVGIIASRGGPLGPNAFMPVYYGANAFFQLLNARGGVNGRSVRLIHCDDAEDPGRNEQCVRHLVDEEKVFAFVANATRSYSGADHVDARGVPDVGGQPIGTEYWTYPTFFTIRGSEMARDGTTVGHQGRVYHQTLQFRWFKEEMDVQRGAVVFYNVPQSQTFADFLIRALRAEGIEAIGYEVNLAFPNFDSVVADMRARGVDAIWDVMEATGNQNLCQAMERGSFSVKAKVGTTNGWSRAVRSQMPAICKESLFAVSESRPNADSANPAVAEFQQTMTTVYGGQRDDILHQWELEGWAAAKLFTDGVLALGADVTRAGLVEWLDARDGYTGGGLLTPIDWRPKDFATVKAGRECLVIARWDERRANFLAVTPVPYCEEDVPYVSYVPS